MARFRILIVDDEEGILEVCSEILKKIPEVSVFTETRGENALERLSSDPFDLLIADIRMHGMNGIQLLEKARIQQSDLSVLMMTAFPAVNTAVTAMKLGALDYITKPFAPHDFLSIVSRILEQKKLREENHIWQHIVDRPYCFDDLIGKSAAMQSVFETIENISKADVDVLITGETGTGKELVARSIHRRSKRKNARFVPVDCGAIPGDLLESEFFGHEKGAFTGANARRMGLLEFANQGTFFLDEIAELPPILQSKLLRVLQERRVRRVGAQEEIPVDIRVIAATARDLPHEIREKRFREDLYYRIHVAAIHLPPLRERQGDIEILSAQLVERYAHELEKPPIEIHPQAMQILKSYSWPGNVRELQNVIKRSLAVLRSNKLEPDDLPDDLLIHFAQNGSTGKEAGNFFSLRSHRVDTFEAEYLKTLLASTSGDIAEVIRLSEIPRATLYRLLKKHGLDPEVFRT